MNSVQPETASTTQEVTTLAYQIERLFNQLMISPNTLTAEKIQSVTQSLIEQTRAHPNAIIGTVHLRTDIKYSVIRAIQNTIFALLVSDQMEWFDEARTLSLCCAALTEHISLYPIRDQLNHQQEGLSPWQCKIIKSYPQKAIRILISIGVNDQRWLHTIGGDSSKEEASCETSILTVVNRYGAMISERGKRKPMGGQEATQTLLSEPSPPPLEVKIGAMLVNILGIYPPGTAVQLHNGETAIVTCKKTIGEPTAVMSVCDVNGKQLKTPIFRDIRQPDYHIEHSITLDWTRHLNIDLFWNSSMESPSNEALFQLSPRVTGN
ncbi:MAG: hypothetical protein HOL04_10780 [Gammaproteobacteria bacterium]|jgi:hypothetical protein|nr:hypothetical protein [Gammaproteobacteria bacterium]MBT4606728.1 hypothetical protein [Thiotrichales bacterium]MBT3473542.1 hypothetical protein [Gammaproteobacteria bacterium]MBT3967925.1 hypothetical protein [Gammaproteobacteria bacterium]MBT4079005.1 hypothetical protein [Gammaproteobacteria bacterium]